jgi:long-chain fatty acid transport protein
MNKPATSLKLVALGMVLAGFTHQAAASGFQLFEGNAVNMGDLGAGGAAIAEDASTAYYNPAGLTRLTAPQIVISAVGISSKTDFSGTSTWKIPGTPFVKTNSGSADGGGTAVIPAFHLAAPINDRVVLGFSLTTPFGLSTEYAPDSVVNSEATESSVKTIDLSPSVGLKLTDNLSVGLGIDYQNLDATLNSASFIPVANINAYSKNQASDWAFGWRAGALYQVTPSTRVGLNYVSKVKHHLTGTSTLDMPAIDTTFGSDAATADLTLPATTTLSAVHDLNSCWTLLGSVSYTQWSEIEDITLKNVASATLNPIKQTIVPTKGTATLPENFRDTWRVAIGTNYKYNDQWLFRAGLGYDQTPVVDEHRGVRLPDGDRIGVSVGTHYQPTKAIGLDVGYTHLFIKDGDINHTLDVGPSKVNTVGTTKNAADLLGLQLTWTIV